jgi:hypothetical protein
VVDSGQAIAGKWKQGPDHLGAPKAGAVVQPWEFSADFHTDASIAPLTIMALRAFRARATPAITDAKEIGLSRPNVRTSESPAFLGQAGNNPQNFLPVPAGEAQIDDQPIY